MPRARRPRSRPWACPVTATNPELLLSAERAALLLSAQRALLGAIGPHLLAVRVDLEPAMTGQILKMWIFVDEAMTTAEMDDLEAAATELIDDFPTASLLDVAIHRLFQPLLPRDATGQWVFIRRGVRLANDRS
jgi:hypothetical protein